jgi:hypothetical protein
VHEKFTSTSFGVSGELGLKVSLNLRIDLSISNGIKQGDPLWPTLFHLVVDLFFLMLLVLI